jgi:hypothetical protein
MGRIPAWHGKSLNAAEKARSQERVAGISWLERIRIRGAMTVSPAVAAEIRRLYFAELWMSSRACSWI